jgi:hypothetical protein
MLSQGPRTAWRAFPTVTSPVKALRHVQYLGPQRGSLHVRYMSATPIAQLAALNCHLRLPPKFPVGIHGISLRCISTNRILRKEDQATSKEGSPAAQVSKSEIEATDEFSFEFKRTEKGEAAREVDLSARLKDRSTQSDKGEVVRLLKLAGREWRTLGGIHLLDPSLTFSCYSFTGHLLWSCNVYTLLNRQNH